jgi:hypothetical protein
MPWFERQFTFGISAGMLPFLLERLEGTIVRMEKKVNGYPEALLSEPFGKKWSIKQNIGHLAEVDQVSNKRIGEMIRGSELLSPAVFEPQDYNQWPIARVLAFFRDVRVNNLVRYRHLSPAEQSLSSVHPRLKVRMTPVDLAYFDAEHDDHHLLKISDIITEHG